MARKAAVESASEEAQGADDRGRGLRADARRNRARIIEVAAEVFAAEGLGVPVHEIARRAGVGTGTVSRHFPTKEALVEAIVGSRAARLAEQAGQLLEEEPGPAFFAYFALIVEAGAANRGLADALAGAGFEIEAVATGSGHDVMGPLHDLLVRAQQAGAIRPDVEPVDVKSLLVGCLARERGGADPAARQRMIEIVREGLRACER